jgi:hypothetical protein
MVTQQKRELHHKCFGRSHLKPLHGTLAGVLPERPRSAAGRAPGVHTSGEWEEAKSRQHKWSNVSDLASSPAMKSKRASPAASVVCDPQGPLPSLPIGAIRVSGGTKSREKALTPDLDELASVSL